MASFHMPYEARYFKGTDLELYFAADRGDAESVQQLLAAAKAAGRVQDILTASKTQPEGAVALHIAADRCHLDVVTLLLEAGAAVDAQTALGMTPLHYAAEAANNWKPASEVLKALLAAGASIDQQDCMGGTAHEACWRAAGMPAAVELLHVLLQAGAAVDVRNKDGQTALHIAAKRGSTAAVKVLLSAGADVTAADNRGRTALHHACSPVLHCSLATVRELLLAGATVDAAGDWGFMLLSGAASIATGPLESRELLECLLAHTSSHPVVPGVLIKAAAHAIPALYELRSSCDGIRQLVSAAIQQDAAAARAALQQHWSMPLIDWPAARGPRPVALKAAPAKVACMWLDMWLAAAAEQAEVEAALPAVQQMVMRVAAEQSEHAAAECGEQAAGEMGVQEET